MYPVPPRARKPGLTETYVGNWLAKQWQFEKLVLCPKSAGPRAITTAAFGPITSWTAKNIREAVVASQRLQFDYLDLIGWPAANQLLWQALGIVTWADAARPPDAAGYPRSADRVPARREDPLIGVGERIAFGVMRYLHTADKHDPPQIVDYSESLQPADRSLKSASQKSQSKGVELLAYLVWLRHTDRQVFNGAKPAGRAIASRFTRSGVRKVV